MLLCIEIKTIFKNLKKTKIMRRLIFTALISATIAALITYELATPAPTPTAITPPAPSSSSTSICMDYDTERMSTLDADLIHTMTRGYRDNQLSYIESKSGTIAPTDAYSIWFDLETLKKYLYHIEKNAMRGDSPIDKSKLGIRIYYATYPDVKTIEKGNFTDLDFLKTDPKYSQYYGLHTLVMIPTCLDDSGKNVDFNPLDKETFKKGFYQDSKYSFGSTSTLPDDTAALTGTPSRSMGGRNHGTLAPPETVVGLGF